ncbi:hypothetical protein CN887_21280 [Bacillus pseudomycoides]|uniref:hypothetical protein n=1 Tax=Bacillus pseudomycoides TaxID=64104 RepID=UPI000BF230E7|nr:hypothetical protein [Bacillus pseudomycoides]PEJ23240.1 hypothetical protein CN887_21280 [Bacillus pseudomycoides]
MKKIKLWMSIVSAIVILTSTFVISTQAIKTSAASPPDCIRCNDGWLTKGEWRDHTPQVAVSYGEMLTISTFQHGYRPFYMRIYNVKTGVTYYDRYTYNYPPEYPYIKVPPGIYAMELKCTTGRTKYNDCNGSGRFDNFKP